MASPERGDSRATMTAPYVLEYTYRRATGPVIGRFLTGLREGRLEGARTARGRVLVPPAEYDPEDGSAIVDFVAVGPEGVVTTWAWVSHPLPSHPHREPFAFVMVKLDGADTALLSTMTGVGTPPGLKTGARVRAKFREARVGHILDLQGFELLEAGAEAATRPGREALPAVVDDPVTRMKSPVHLTFTVPAGRALTRSLAAVLEGRLLGQRCPSCTKVYVPARGACPSCGVPLGEEVIVKESGTVTTFCVVNVPFEGQTMKLPYIYACILLDGADLPIWHLVSEIPAEEARQGLRVRAAWKPAEERTPSMESIRWFVPTGEPDAPFDSFKEHL